MLISIGCEIWGKIKEKGTNRCKESPRCDCQTGKLLDMDGTYPVDHLTQPDFARWDETVLVLFGDAALVAREHDEVTFGLANEEHIFVNGGYGRSPNSLIVSTDFFQSVVGAVLPLGILDNADALHQVGNHDEITDDGEIDGCR